MTKKARSFTPPKFQVGDRVRVKQGIRDADYPDMPLGGWAGTISEVHNHGMYTVRWSQETLAAIHPVFLKRCERDGMDMDQYWLGDDDLELDAGDPLTIEHPTMIRTKPLSPKDQDDRVRMVFDLTSDDPLPEADYDTLETYREYLTEHLVFPFDASYTGETVPFANKTTKVTVTSLGDPDDAVMIDDSCGILCNANYERNELVLPLGDMEVQKGNPNRKLVEDYSYWFWDNR